VHDNTILLLKTLTDLKNLETLKLFPTNRCFSSPGQHVQNARLGNVFCSLKTFIMHVFTKYRGQSVFKYIRLQNYCNITQDQGVDSVWANMQKCI